MKYEELFEVVRVTSEAIVIKVKEIDNLTRATYPWMCDVNTEYISVKRGPRGFMTFIYKDGTSWSLDYNTLCTDKTSELKSNIIRFIESTGYKLK